MNKLKQMIDFLLSSVRLPEVAKRKSNKLSKDKQLEKIEAAKQKRLRKATRGW